MAKASHEKEIRAAAWRAYEGAITVKRLLVALIALVLVVLFTGNYRVQFTESAPKGIMRFADSDYERGSKVIACLPVSWASWALDRGYAYKGNCAGGTMPLYKEVIALPGDTVEVTADGIVVNRTLVPDTRVPTTDSAGRSIEGVPPGSWVVPAGEVWLGSHHERGFDSRIFGGIDAALITGVRVGLLTGRPSE